MATVYDRITQAAQAKQGYVSGAPTRSAAPYRRPQRPVSELFAPGSVGMPRGITPPKKTPLSDTVDSIIKNKSFSQEAGGIAPAAAPGGWGGMVRDVFGGIITAADALKSGYQTTAGEIGDLVSNIPVAEPFRAPINALAGNPFQLRGQADEEGNRDQSFDIGDISFKDSQFLEAAPWTENLPGPVKPVVGFLGDVATDPLTYLTAGTVKAGVGLATGAARVTVAQDLAEQIAKKGGKELIADQVAQDLIREAGSRGLGAFTQRGLKRIGATSDDLARLGVESPDFRYTLGVGKKKAGERGVRVTLPGSRRAAELSEDFKGIVKQYAGGSRAGELARKLRYSSKTGERELVSEILKGTDNSAQAALGLVSLRKGRAEGYRWMFAGAEELGRTGINKLDDKSARALTHAIEAGELDELGGAVADWLQKAGTQMQEFGILGADNELLKLRSGYMPHRLSQEALDNMDNPGVKRFLNNSASRKEAFQKAREYEGTIADINKRFKLETGLDFNLLEDNAHVLLTDYLDEGRAAIMRNYAFGEQGAKIGTVSRLQKGVDSEKVNKAVGDAVAEQEAAIQASIQARKKAAQIGAKAAREQRDVLRAGLNKSKRAVANAERAVVRANSRIAENQSRLQALEEAATAQRAVATAARGKEKAAATRAIRKIESEMEQLSQAVEFDAKKLASAENRLGQHAETLRQSEAALKEADDRLQEAESFRSSLEEVPFDKPAVDAETAAVKAEQKLEAQKLKFAESNSADETAAMTNTWIGLDEQAKANKLERELKKYTDWLAKPATRANRRSLAGLQESQDELRERVGGLLKILRESDDENVKMIASLDAQAAVADMQALRAGKRATVLARASHDEIMANPKFQDLVTLQAEVGMSQIGETAYAADPWYRDVIEKLAEFQDPATRSDAYKMAAKAVEGYGKALGWWKAWAVASPGFHLRNMYSGGFGMYLDGVLPTDAVKFNKFRNYWVKNGDEATRKWALAKYDEQTVDNLFGALDVTAGSGWGISAQEASDKLVGDVTTGWNPLDYSKNPLSSKSFLPQKSKQFGEAVEAGMRGGHAFSVLQRGGSFNEALARVEKFHFNYRDISEFDQVAKKVMPFWTFFSRNIALQAQVWMRNPGKLNRSYFNAKRNIEFMSEEDQPVPDYLLWSMGGIRTPWGGEEGGRMYLTPDLPSIRFRETVADPKGELINSLTPAIKTPIEMLSNTDQFTGREFRNSLTTFGEDGEIPRLAPGVLQLPGVKQAASLLPGADIYNGQLLMQDNTQKAVESINPLLGRTNRLFPNMPRQQETRRQAVMGFAGLPGRWNDPGSQAGEMARRTEIIKNEAANRALQEKLNTLTGGG